MILKEFFNLSGPKPTQCPSCRRADTLPKSHQRGFWEKRILGLLGLRPYQCTSCGTRFHSLNFALGDGLQARTTREKAAQDLFSVFLPPQDDRDFQGLIQEIREAEKEMGLSENDDKNKSKGDGEKEP